MRRIVSPPPRHQLPRYPGVDFAYSNLGIDVLGHALARKRIWEPLGMTHTAITLTPWMRDHLALGHDPAGKGVENWNLPPRRRRKSLEASRRSGSRCERVPGSLTATGAEPMDHRVSGNSARSWRALRSATANADSRQPLAREPSYDCQRGAIT
jgi:CubicO group peptidase (beta-lactamase class C family)